MTATDRAWVDRLELEQIRRHDFPSRQDHVRALLALAAVFALMWLAAALGTLLGGPTPDTRYEDGTVVWSDGHVTCERGALCGK